MFLRLMLLLTASFLLGAATPDGGFVVVKGRRLLAEVARTPQERERGLAFRSMFKAERCMFVVCEQEQAHPVRTRKFLLPFDLVWVDAAGQVVELASRVPPCKGGQDCVAHGGKVPSRYYLFLPAGMAARTALKVGDTIRWDLHFSDGTTLRNGPPMPPDALPGTGKRSGRRKRK